MPPATSLVQGDAAEPYRWLPYGWTDAFGLSVKVAGPLPVLGESRGEPTRGLNNIRRGYAHISARALG